VDLTTIPGSIYFEIGPFRRASYNPVAGVSIETSAYFDFWA